MIQRPLPESVCAHRATMPKLNGHILDPRMPPEAVREAYLEEWGKWFRANPLYREPWMLDLIAWGKRRNKPTSRGPNSIPASQQSIEPTG